MVATLLQRHGRIDILVNAAGVVALTRSAAQGHRPQGIRVNALCPGWVDTPMAEPEMQQLAAEQGISPQQAR